MMASSIAVSLFLLASNAQASEEVPEVEPMQRAEGQADAPSQPGAEALNLICFGGGSANKPNVGTAYAWNNSGDSATATIIGTRSQGFGDQVGLRLDGQSGQVRMPRAMLPALRGGKDGWFGLTNIRYKSNEITATVLVNVVNHPKLRLDRYTGTISISGKAGDYAGRCEAFDPEKMERRF